MKREEEIQEKAKSLYYHFCVRETCEGEENDCVNCPYGKVIEPLVTMAKWADNHPKEGLVDTKKVEQWIKSCFEFLNKAGNHNFKIDKFIDNFRRTVEE